MIIELEIQAFINRIEAKLAVLSGSNKEMALSNINILNRVLIELKENNKILKTVIDDFRDSEIKRSECLIAYIELQKENEMIKENNINSF